MSVLGIDIVTRKPAHAPVMATMHFLIVLSLVEQTAQKEKEINIKIKYVLVMAFVRCMGFAAPPTKYTKPQDVIKDIAETIAKYQF